MSDYQSQETRNASAAQRVRESERLAALAYENERAQQAVHKTKIRRRASIKAAINGILAFGVVIGLCFALRAGLIASVLAWPVILLALAWMAFWFGAWAQFMWCKGGLLEWRK